MSVDDGLPVARTETGDEIAPGPAAQSFKFSETGVLLPVESAAPVPAETRFLKWTVIGPDGLRAGWSVLLFIVLTMMTVVLFSFAGQWLIHSVLHLKAGQFTAASALIQETVSVLGVAVGALIMARIEKRKIWDYNLRGPRRLTHFLVGIGCGIAALSALVGALDLGGWLRFGPIALTGAQIVEYGTLWALAFLLTGFFEEGSFRCYMQYTLTRGINFWWAAGVGACLCLLGFLNKSGSGAGGVDVMFLLGVIPCLLLYRMKSPAAGFWQAAWLTSSLFGYIHTFNSGETWIGIFAAAFIGFVFCVSIRLTGSAWWAIGFHASWDWSETYFYGTADSGLVAQGHFLSTSPAGAEFWSGGSAGPEGSVLVLAIALLTMLLLIVVYRKRGTSRLAPGLGEPAVVSGLAE